MYALAHQKFFPRRIENYSIICIHQILPMHTSVDGSGYFHISPLYTMLISMYQQVSFEPCSWLFWVYAEGKRLSQDALSEALTHCSSQRLDHFTVPSPCVPISPHRSHVLFCVCGFWQSLFSSRAGSLWHFLTPDTGLSIQISLLCISELPTHFILLLKRPSNLIQFYLLSSIYLKFIFINNTCPRFLKVRNHKLNKDSFSTGIPPSWQSNYETDREVTDKCSVLNWGAVMQPLTWSY